MSIELCTKHVVLTFEQHTIYSSGRIFKKKVLYFFIKSIHGYIIFIHSYLCNDVRKNLC
jgi:hypothetical protein